MSFAPPPLPWLAPGSHFPAVENAWPPNSEAPGLLAVGADLSMDSLLRAYSQGIFPWFSEGQPILWWSPDPRMVLHTSRFRLHRSLRKTLLRFKNDAGCEIRVDSAFSDVMQACANSARSGHPGTWILPSMVEAYLDLHHAGHAHSIETWQQGKLVGGLYCVSIGRAVFGESMFTRITDASKIALAALVALCRENSIEWVDCQQNTAHLSSLGAAEIPRSEFVEKVRIATEASGIAWRFDPLYWRHLLVA